ncbi:MAG: L-ribulose-5-phosphate 4-epimerase [Lachnospiraceae bacterium]|nr:L-ribulose-5-phosphate 4-epimerase [Lachnospiraceae bacterium]
MLESLKQKVLDANLCLPKFGLVTFTWGNVSAIDRESGLVVIKPSGLPYEGMTAEDMVVVNLGGSVVEGKWRPSSDTPTHLEIYQAFPAIGGICHTHSEYATSWAQAGRGIPCYGTTHADYFYGEVPCLRCLTEEEIRNDYEKNTGKLIVSEFARQGLDPEAMPAVLLKNHGPFTWGPGAIEAVNTSLELEVCAKMAFFTERIDPDVKPVPKALEDKHYFRKHGKDAYYGQK